MQLSVVIPVYNGERYIAECLESLLCQWVPGVEVIVVNDGSTDGTGGIVDIQFEKYLKTGVLRHIRTPNGGVSAARNLGIEYAKGEYVALVDADDRVTFNYLEVVLASFSCKPDLVELSWRTITPDGDVLQNEMHLHKKFGLHKAEKINETTFSRGVWYPVLRVVRRSIYSMVRFPVGVRFCEDLMAISKIYPLATSICTLPDVVYEYRISPAGATVNIRPDYAENLIEFYRSIIGDHTYLSQALKVSVAYSARRCLIGDSNKFGRLPPDLEADLRILWIRNLRLLFNIRPRFLAYAVAGPWLYRIKYCLSRMSIRNIRPKEASSER